MHCFIYNVQYTEYVRVADGQMDTTFSHTEISKRDLAVVVPDERDEDKARVFVQKYSGYDRDENFKILEVTNHPVNAIIPSPMLRL